MKKLAFGVLMVAGVTLGVGSMVAACGSSDGETSKFDAGDPDAHGDSLDGTIGNGDGGDGGPRLTGGDDSGEPGGCEGFQCDIVTNCGDGGTNNGINTTITGRVLDPAGTEPIYNALVYVPLYDPKSPTIPEGKGIQPIAGGVTFPTGVSCDSCSYLFTGYPVAVGSTGPDGTFTIPNAPSGTNIPVIVQIGKWRTSTTVSTVTSCGTASAGNIKLPSKIPAGDTIDSMPQFALSMGDSDSLECLLYRIGIDLSEFTAGPSATGHVHLFTGAQMGATTKGSAPPAPYGYEQLWDSLDDLKKYDVSVFSCEGQETTDANPQILHDYVNAGGRAFLSHFHYSWITGPIDTDTGNGTLDGVSYAGPADWKNLATWNTDDTGVLQNTRIGVKVDSDLTGNDAGPFLKGQVLTQWLTGVNAFDMDGGTPADEVPVIGPAFDPLIGPTNTESQEWGHYDPASYQIDPEKNGNWTVAQPPPKFPAAYFSFNTPVDAVSTDGGAAPYCGRVVYSGLHVGGAAHDTTTVYSTLYPTQLPSATTCNPAPGNLSPQEKILEFILFDLSGCVTPDTAAPAPPVTGIR